MSQAFFAIAGAIVGALGTVLTTLVGARHEERRVWREALRSVCANLTSEVSQLRDLSHQLHRDPGNPDLRQAAEQAHTRARGFQEQLRLTSRSAATQEAGRWLIHCVYYQWRATQGGRGDFWAARKELDMWLTKLYVEARKELGLGASDVYEDPSGGLPVPGDRKQIRSEASGQKDADQAGSIG
jgi:hypothetical protein